MIDDLKKSWKASSALKYEAKFHEPIIDTFCQWHSSNDNGRDVKGRIFNAGYEVYIYSFFVGLYRNVRRPLKDATRSFSMEIYRLGDVSTKGTKRRKYTEIQDYIFASLIAKSNLDLVEFDKGNISTKEAVDVLMNTLNEYANAGFYAISEKLLNQEDYFFNSRNVVEFVNPRLANIMKKSWNEQE